jgi:hypothetical protein
MVSHALPSDMALAAADLGAGAAAWTYYYYFAARAETD